MLLAHFFHSLVQFPFLVDKIFKNSTRFFGREIPRRENDFPQFLQVPRTDDATARFLVLVPHELEPRAPENAERTTVKNSQKNNDELRDRPLA
jgi:hypothetical protein